MCGLAGAIATKALDAIDKEIVFKLVAVNRFRGPDSIGLVDGLTKPEEISKDKKKIPAVYKYAKYNSDPWDFLQYEWGNWKDERWDKGEPFLLSFHCRLATIGKIVHKNAHPFRHGNIIGMHNGTIKNEFKNSKKFETDSEALIYNISEMGVLAALEEVKDKNPAYAIIFIDLKGNTINFIRNFERPLHYARYGNTLFWSSEAESLEFARKALLPVKFNSNVLYTLPLNERSNTFTEIDYNKELTATWFGGQVSGNFTKGAQPPKNTVKTLPMIIKNNGTTASEKTKGKDHNVLFSLLAEYDVNELLSFKKMVKERGRLASSVDFCNYRKMDKKWFTRADDALLNRADDLLHEKTQLAKDVPSLHHVVNGVVYTEGMYRHFLQGGCATCGRTPKEEKDIIIGEVYEVVNGDFTNKKQSAYICDHCMEAITEEGFNHWIIDTNGYLTEETKNKILDRLEAGKEVPFTISTHVG